MAEIGRWNNHVFEVSPTSILSFSMLSLKSASETEDKESGGHKYVKRKNGKPMEVTANIILSAHAGCDVRREALAFVEDAYNGASDYFYIQCSKLIDCMLMLTEAQAKEITIRQGPAWEKAELSLTFKQCDKYGNAAGTGRDSKKKSTKRRTPKAELGETWFTRTMAKVREATLKYKPGGSDGVDAVTGAAPHVDPEVAKRQQVSSATAHIRTIVSKGKLLTIAGKRVNN